MDTQDQGNLTSVTDTPRSVFSQRLIWLLLILASVAILAVVLHRIASESEEQEVPSPSKKTQVVPKGTAPLEVDQALTALNLPEPLPFFDTKNVVQSLNFNQTSTSTDKVFLSYRVQNQTIDMVYTAYTEYLLKHGWNPLKSATPENKDSFFFEKAIVPGKFDRLSIILLDEEHGSPKGTVTIALILSQRSALAPQKK